MSCSNVCTKFSGLFNGLYYLYYSIHLTCCFEIILVLNKCIWNASLLLLSTSAIILYEHLPRKCPFRAHGNFSPGYHLLLLLQPKTGAVKTLATCMDLDGMWYLYNINTTPLYHEIFANSVQNITILDEKESINAHFQNVMIPWFNNTRLENMYSFDKTSLVSVETFQLSWSFILSIHLVLL